jgi:putative membrane protein
MLILRWFLSAVALILVSYIVPGFHVDSLTAAFITALLLGLVNAIIRPILLLLTLPINILTLGLFTLVINALMLLLVSSIYRGFTIDSFSSALWGGLILWVIGWITNAID